MIAHQKISTYHIPWVTSLDTHLHYVMCHLTLCTKYRNFSWIPFYIIVSEFVMNIFSVSACVGFFAFSLCYGEPYWYFYMVKLKIAATEVGSSYLLLVIIWYLSILMCRTFYRKCSQSSKDRKFKLIWQCWAIFFYYCVKCILKKNIGLKKVYRKIFKIICV